jgi:hypothetical protein
MKRRAERYDVTFYISGLQPDGTARLENGVATIRSENPGDRLRYAVRGGDCADHALRQPAAKSGSGSARCGARAPRQGAAIRYVFPRGGGAASMNETLERQQSAERDWLGPSEEPGASERQMVLRTAPQTFVASIWERPLPAAAAGMTSALRRNWTISRVRRVRHATRSHPNAEYCASGRLMSRKRRSLACA